MCIRDSCNGSSVNIEWEQKALIPNAARLIGAYAQAGIPKLTVVTGKAVGDGFAMMCPKALGADMVYAWPTAEISSMPCLLYTSRCV